MARSAQRALANDAAGGFEAWQLSLFRLVSPALPVGAFAYSRGLEYAVHSGAVHDEASASAWLLGLLRHTATQLDAPLFLRLYDAFAARDLVAAERWNALVRASRESQELRLEDAQMGAAFARLLVSLDVDDARAWHGRADASYLTLFALATHHHRVPRAQALLGYLWAWIEAQTSAAVRLVPLGQTAGQRILLAAISGMTQCAEQAAAVADDDIGSFAPNLALGSALHETQYTRLFRS